MAVKFLKHRWQKIVLVTVLIFTVVLLLLAFLVNHYWSPILADKIKSTVIKSSDSLYTAHFSSAELDVLQGKIILYNVSFIPDTVVYNKRKAQHIAPNNLVEVHAKRLVLAHIHPFKLYFKHILDIGRISLSGPEVRLTYHLNRVNDTTTTDNRTVWAKVSKSLRSIHVGDIFLNDARFKYEDYSGKKVATSQLKQIDLHANELLIDSATQNDRSRILYCKDIVTVLNNYKGTSQSGLYTYTIKKVKLSSLTSQLTAEGLTLEPIKTNLFFGKTLQDKYTVHLDSLQLNDFDFISYHKYHSLNASNLVLSHAKLDLFNNPNKPVTHIDKINTFPNVAIYQLATQLKVDTITVKDIDVSYTEFNKRSQQSGTITFNNTYGKFFNVTNNKAALQKNNTCTVQLNTRFMNSGKFNVHFAFNLSGKDAAYSYTGHLGAMNLRVVNEVTMPLAMVKISTGTLKSFDFDIHGNSKVSKGRVTFLYNDTKVTLLKPDSANKSLKRKTIESLYANVFIVKHSNPDKEGEIPRSFYITYNRPVNSPFFKTAWQTLLTGIKPAVGFDKKAQEAVSVKKTEKDIKKKNHQIKKQLRKQKREEKKQRKELEKEQKEALKKES